MLLPSDFPKHEINTTFEVNSWLNMAFDTKRPFSYIRIGNTEAICMVELMKGNKISRKIKPWLTINAGVFPDSHNYLYNTYYPMNLSAIYSADCLSFVPNDKLKPLDFFRNINLKANLVDSNWISDPIMLAYIYQFDNSFTPWTVNLKNKKILFITPFHHSFLYQKNKLNLIWHNGLSEIIIPSDYLSIIQSPFNPKISGTYLYDAMGQKAVTWGHQ